MLSSREPHPLIVTCVYWNIECKLMARTRTIGSLAGQLPREQLARTIEIMEHTIVQTLGALAIAITV